MAAGGVCAEVAEIGMTGEAWCRLGVGTGAVSLRMMACLMLID